MSCQIQNSQENKLGYFGCHGGQFVSAEMKARLDEVADCFNQYKNDSNFLAELNTLYKHFSGRPTPVFYCENLSKQTGGADIYLKREDLNHLGSHKLNNALGQLLLAKRLGKKHIIAETGAGQHGVATAAVCALYGLKCTIYMGEEDIRRQELNALRMKMMGANVVPAKSGQRTLKEAVDEALNAYIQDKDSYYLLGTAAGPYPYPEIVRHFQSIISFEAKTQFREMTNTLPDMVIACVGGGSNAMGAFAHFIEEKDVALVGVEAGGIGCKTGENAASLLYGKKGILHGCKSYVCLDEKGDVAPAYSISAGLDYPGVSPELAHLKDTGRASFTAITDKEAVSAFFMLSKTEGIIPALESAHALAHAIHIAPDMKGKKILVNLSGRGDKDVAQISAMLKENRIQMP